jgi:predicted nucleic acid-binding protein
MTVYYADSSALVKRYVNEVGSAWVQAICDPLANHIIALAHVGLAEIAAALGMKYRQNLLTAEIRDRLLRDLQRDGRDQYWLVDVDQDIVTDAIALTRRQKLRGYDAIHLACAVFLEHTLVRQGLPGLILVSADQDLLAAAQAEGLLTDNPNLHV